MYVIKLSAGCMLIKHDWAVLIETAKFLDEFETTIVNL